jgi:hypothetical protein
MQPPTADLSSTTDVPDRIAGNSLFRMKAYLQKQHGPDAWARIVGRMSEAHQPIVRGVVLSSAQYERALYYDLLEAIDAELGRPALLESARVQAGEQFTGFFGVLLRVVPTEVVLGKVGDYWRKVWSVGHLQLVSRSEREVDAIVTDFDMPEVHRAHNEAYFETFLGQLTGERWRAKAEQRGKYETHFHVVRER